MEAFSRRFQERETVLGADQGPELRSTTTALLVLATVLVVLRFASRYVVGRLYGSDDWTMIAALVVAFATGGLNYAMIVSGLGQHAATLSQDQLVQFFKLLLAFECIYVTGVALVKISVLLMYLRIFPSSGFRIASIIIGSSVIAWWIAIVFVCIFQCTPVKKAWMPWIDGTCIDLKASFIGNAIPNIATDLAILSLPIRQVLKLQVNAVQKLSILFMFLLGSFVLFASIYRFYTIMRFDTNDTTWTLAVACTWCVVEVCCGAISGCLPTLRPLMMRISHRFGSLPGSSSINTGRKEPVNSNSTELITVGGTGRRMQSRNTEDLSNLLYDEDCAPEVGNASSRPKLSSTHNRSSDDERPLHKSTRVD